MSNGKFQTIEDVYRLSPREIATAEAKLFEYPLDSVLLGGRQSVVTSFSPGDGSRPGEVIVMSGAWADGPESHSQLWRQKLIATVTGLPVIGVGMPGMGINVLPDGVNDRIHYNISEQQRDDLRRGSFSEVGHACLLAVNSAISYYNLDKPKKPVAHFLGYSMGTSVVAGMVDNDWPMGFDVGRVVSVEAAANQCQKPRQLIAAGLSKVEREASAEYIAANPDWSQPTKNGLVGLSGNVLRRPAVHYLAIVAMAQGLAPSQLHNGLYNRGIGADTELLVVNGGLSMVSPTNANDAAAAYLQADRVVWADARHAECDNLARYVLRVADLLS